MLELIIPAVAVVALLIAQGLRAGGLAPQKLEAMARQRGWGLWGQQPTGAYVAITPEAVAAEGLRADPQSGIGRALHLNYVCASPAGLTYVKTESRYCLWLPREKVCVLNVSQRFEGAKRSSIMDYRTVAVRLMRDYRRGNFGLHHRGFGARPLFGTHCRPLAGSQALGDKYVLDAVALDSSDAHPIEWPADKERAVYSPRLEEALLQKTCQLDIEVCEDLLIIVSASSVEGVEAMQAFVEGARQLMHLFGEEYLADDEAG